VSGQGGRGPPRVSVILTIGHSTHSADAFLALLERHGVGRIADVRTVPKSRRHPQFGADVLAAFLGQHDIEYRHFPALGGLRKPRRDSINTAWHHPGFRGYADHMLTAEFAEGLAALIEFS